jgi:hypothetical protein
MNYNAKISSLSSLGGKRETRAILAMENQSMGYGYPSSSLFFYIPCIKGIDVGH